VTETAKVIAQEFTRQRESKGMTMAQLSAKTKIAERFIEAMEKGEFNFLPAVYVRAFIRTLSVELGLDPEVMVRQFLNLDGVKPVDKPSESTAVETKKETPLHLAESDVREIPLEATTPKEIMAADNPRDQRILIVGTFAVLAVIVSVVYFMFLRPSQETPLLDTGTVVEKVEPGVPADTSNLIPLHESVNVEVQPADELNLTIKVSDSAWVRIVYKDSLVDEGMFSPGDGRSWVSFSRFYLKIGNAGGVRLYLNNQDLGNAGDRGRVANLLIDKQGVAKITEAEFPALMKQTLTP
jgi:cytoskeleton protein RodZ